MQGPYFLNLKTGRLHIEGFCKESARKPYEIKYFQDVEDATVFAQGHLMMCKICQRQRDIKSREWASKKT